jgi:hypothetical protein
MFLCNISAGSYTSQVIHCNENPNPHNKDWFNIFLTDPE